MEKLYTLRDACAILQIDPTTLRKWDREGKIRCVRLQNNFRRVPESEINRIFGVEKERGPLSSPPFRKGHSRSVLDKIKGLNNQQSN